MLIITTIEMFPTLTDADLKYLSSLKAADRICVLSKPGATMPVNMFMTLSSLKCPLDIKEMDTKDLFQLGYTIGSLCESSNDKVTILTDRNLEIDNKKVTVTNSLTGAKPAAKPVTKKVTTKASESTPKAAQTSSEKPSEPHTAPKKRRGKSLMDILLSYPELKKYKKVIETSEEAISQAIVAASDAEIGLPFQLQLRGFGDEKDAIAQAIKKDFAKIKEKISM